MDSPEGNRIPATSSPASSPAVQESPFFNYLCNLSPIKSAKAVHYKQRFSETNFPSPLPVFTSPRIDLQRESIFLKRDEIDAACSDVYGQCGTRLKAVPIACFEKQVQTCSPSGCIDEFLADPVEVDCTNSADLHSQPANYSPQLSQSDFTGPKETINRVDDADVGSTEIGVPMLSDQAEDDLHLSSLKLAETAVVQTENERFDEFIELTSKKFKDLVESDMSLDPVSGAQQCEQYVDQIVEAYEGSDESSRSVSEGYVKEGNQHQRGTRRHLQFEAAVSCKSTFTGSSHSPCNLQAYYTTNSRLPAIVTNLESLVSSHYEPRGISSVRQTVSYAQTINPQSSFCPSEFLRSTPNGRNSAISAPIPSGVGLHLNRICQSASMGLDMIARKKPAGYWSSQEEKLVPERSYNLANDLNDGSISAVAGKICPLTEDDQPVNQYVVTASSATSQSTNSTKTPHNSLHLTRTEQQTAPSEERMCASQSAGRVEELNQVNPNRKRKRPKHISEIEGCKRCNCKRSKCLKLYCECFAAGIYCVDSCACENCFNKPEYEDTVLDTRQQIESRNPLAFAPKIVKHATDSPANIVEDGNWTTPSSARHKRGCNCKKSKCLKKYCECYQANIGCSDGCRCEDCRNSFGTKSVCRNSERKGNPYYEKMDTIETGKNDQFSPTWEGLVDISLLSPLSHPRSVAADSSALPNTRDSAKVSQAQLYQGSSIQAPDGSLRRHCSPISFMQHLCGSSTPNKLSSNSALYDIMEDDDTPEILKDISTPTKAVKASSPNQKRVSPPQFSSQGLRSSSSPGLRSGRKFILQAVPSFPPLTPYTNSKYGINQSGSNSIGDTSIQ